ncbi:MAG: hypothetical protein Q9225_006774, partial [Loekoesia sp. 1 TL-2023]
MFNSSTQPISNATNIDSAPPPSSTSLSAPFPVPDTDVILLFGPRGINLSLLTVYLALQDLVSKAWNNVAVNHGVNAVPQYTTPNEPIDRVVITMQSRKSGNTFLMTDSDLIEGAVGVILYMVQHGFFATKVTIVRPNESGTRVPVGDMEISPNRRRVQIAGSEKDTSAIETS